jgi:hypothetical protein
MTSFWKTWFPRITAGLGIASLAVGGGLAAADIAQAADEGATVPVTDVGLSWRVNDESGGGAYFGGCNFLVAGVADDNGASKVWASPFSDKNYLTDDGNVTITKPDASGNQVAPTWANKCQTGDGTTVTTASGSTSGNQVNFTGGTGTVNATADSAELTFEGSFTIVFYGGLTYWSITDPHLSVVDGTGTLTGTASGYGADMNDATKWVALGATEIELATLEGVDVTDTGIEVTPEYAGVEVSVTADGPSAEQVRTGDGWGSFPQSWVDFNVLTGQAAYWYSSGGLADPKKAAAPIAVSYAENTATYATATPDRVPEGYDGVVTIGAANLPDTVTGELGARVGDTWLSTEDGATSVPVTGASASGEWRVDALAAGVHTVELVEVDAASGKPTTSTPLASTQVTVVGGLDTDAPSGLAANGTSSGATLSWSWPSDALPDFDVKVYAGSSAAGDPVATATAKNGATTASVSGLQASTGYTAVVTPTLGGEELWRSAETTFTTSAASGGGSGGDATGGGTTPATPTTPADDDAAASDGATMYWGLNMEANAGAYFGGCNFLVAGRTGDAGGSHVWLASEASKLYKAQDGNVSIVKPSGTQLGLATWENKCLDRNGNPVSVTGKDSYTEAQVKLSNGEVVRNDGSGVRIEWDGSFTVVFYGGMTYWSATDPVLELDANGNGALTATASGFGASMQDASKWVELDSTTITLANLSGVDVSGLDANGGFVHTPDYLGVAYSGSGDGQEVQGGDSSTATQQAAKNSDNQAYWGSFPSDFVDFQNQTGQFSYWFTSNGQRDPYKPTLPMTVSLSDTFTPTVGEYTGQSTPTVAQTTGTSQGGTSQGTSSQSSATAPPQETTQTGAPAQQAAAAATDAVGGDARGIEITPPMLVSGGSALLGIAGLQWAGTAFFRRRLGLDPSTYV